MHRKRMTLILKLFTTFILVNMLFILNVDSVWAKDLISCRYVKASGQNVVLELNIENPVPAMVIVMQKIPKGTSVINATPNFKKYNRASGEIKWLLASLKPGHMLVTMNLSKSVHKGDVTGEIHYKSPTTGTTVRMAIVP